MRIAQVCDSYLPRLGGMEIQVAGLAGRQLAAGHDVEVITASARGGERDDGPPVHRIVEVSSRLLAPVAAARHVLAGDFDVVHAHVGVGSPVAFAVAAAAAGAGIPTVITVHSLWAYVHPLFRAVDLVGGLSRLPIRWTAVSEAAAAPVRRLLPPGAEVSTLPNGVEPGDWAVEPQPGAAGTVTVVAVMRLTTRKRILPLLDILQRARERISGSIALRAVVLGDGPRRAAAERRLRRHGMTSWATLAGRASHAEIAAVHRRADVFVAPADLESFGIAALEARCAGLPVLAKQRSGVREFVRHGREGLLAGDDDQLVEHLVRLATDRRLRESIRDHNRRTPSPITWTSVLARADTAYAAAARAAEPTARRLQAAGVTPPRTPALRVAARP